MIFSPFFSWMACKIVLNNLLFLVKSLMVLFFLVSNKFKLFKR